MIHVASEFPGNQTFQGLTARVSSTLDDGGGLAATVTGGANELSIGDRQQLVRLLGGLPEFATEPTRRSVLELAGLGPLIQLVDLSGAPLIAVSNVVSRLSSYGRVATGEKALGLLLNLVKDLVGSEARALLDTLLDRYNMMTPVSVKDISDTWRGSDTTTLVNERIIRENTLRPIAFLAEGLRVARSVALVEVTTPGSRLTGTGFLVAPDLMITNNHVLSAWGRGVTAVARFNYEHDFQGAPQPSQTYRLAPGVFHTCEHLDYTIAQLEGTPGDDWGWLPLASSEVRAGSRLNIIQHPGGQPKQISLQNNFAEYVGGHVVQYVTSTLPGSSGSPVLNNDWAVIALHHAGGKVREPTTGRVYFRNEGILAAKILADLPPDLHHRLTSKSR
ncbi:trypsin-like peptidase domain-containing protein [Frankia tisae]|uniref:trypsin-like peptidase domain-containing protein n=1 Tax=Frankia tisae TaxID=2950104 RepID=UPI0021BEAFD0|nr:trypsin-like peptidase domain-containing protein [Frankia tisae]